MRESSAHPLNRLLEWEREHPLAAGHVALWRMDDTPDGFAPPCRDLATDWGKLPCPTEDLPESPRPSLAKWQAAFYRWSDSLTAEGKTWHCGAVADKFLRWWDVGRILHHIDNPGTLKASIWGEPPFLLLVHVPVGEVVHCGIQSCFTDSAAIVKQAWAL